MSNVNGTRRVQIEYLAPFSFLLRPQRTRIEGSIENDPSRTRAALDPRLLSTQYTKRGSEATISRAPLSTRPWSPSHIEPTRQTYTSISGGGGCLKRSRKGAAALVMSACDAVRPLPTRLSPLTSISSPPSGTSKACAMLPG